MTKLLPKTKPPLPTDPLANNHSDIEYSAARECILSKLTECEGVSKADQCT